MSDAVRFARQPSRAIDVPEFRADLVDMAMDGTLDIHDRHVSVADGWELDSDRRRWLECAPRQLEESRLWWIGADVMDLAELAAPDLPSETTLTPELLGDPFGLMAFERPFLSFAENGQVLPVVAFWWAVGVSNGTHVEVTLGVWVDVSTTRPGTAIVYAGRTAWGDAETIDVLDAQSAVDWRMLVAVLSLSRSPGITTTDTDPVDRSTRRRLERRERPVDAPRVVHLRRSTSSDGTPSTGSYHHRWIVRGHWRSQPCGPRNSHRRPVYIAPHVKGPEGAPLLTGDVVTSFTLVDP